MTHDRSPRTLQAEIERLQATVAAQHATIKAQHDVITTLVAAAEDRAETVTDLGVQHLVEERTTRLHHGERVLRSVIEALDGALCIVGADGVILDANRRWLHHTSPSAHPRGGSGEVGAPGRPDPATAPGAIGSNFFTWCRTAPGMHDLLSRAAALVQDAITTDPPPDHPGAAVPPDQTHQATRSHQATQSHQVTPGGHDDRSGPASGRSVKGRVGPDGDQRWIVVRVHPIRDHDAARAVVSMIDITEGMRTQDQLRQATEEAQRLALVARATDSAVVITRPDGTIEWVNDPFTHRTGYTLQEALGRQRIALEHGSCHASPEFADFLARIDLGQGADGEFPMASRHGDLYWAYLQVRPVLDGEQVTHLVWVEQDITARRQTQQRLREAMTRTERLASALSQEKTLLTGVISAVPQLVFWKDGRGRYVGCNAAYLAFRGLGQDSDLLGRDEASLGRDDAMARVLGDLEPQVIASGQAVVDRKVDLADSHGQVRALLLSVLPLAQDIHGPRGVIGVGADITHARELEHQLAQANRLESIGQLAAGIAHEINTPIQYVSDNTQFIADATTGLLEATRRIAAFTDPTDTDHPAAGAHPPPESEGPVRDQIRSLLESVDLGFLTEEIPAALAECREGLTRVTEIVRAMKDYAHPGSGRADIDVNRAIESTVQVCRNEWKYVAHLDLDLAPDAGHAPCFEGELKQAILNMIVNAAQAIGEDRDRRHQSALGTITVTTRRDTEDLLITIADNGPGMDDKTRRRVFDPFFTTKDVGKGTGQGLSLAHSVIVTKHQGRIDLDTAPGHGATFTLHLPLQAPTDDTDTGPNDVEGDQP